MSEMTKKISFVMTPMEGWHKNIILLSIICSLQTVYLSTNSAELFYCSTVGDVVFSQHF